MTDKKKEQLKEIVGDVFRQAEATSIEYYREGYDEAEQTILSLIDRQPMTVTREWIKDTAQWMTGTPDATIESMTFLLESILKKLGKKVEEG